MVKKKRPAFNCFKGSPGTVKGKKTIKKPVKGKTQTVRRINFIKESLANKVARNKIPKN